MKVLITGASGFLGRHLLSTLLESTDYDLVGAIRGEGKTVSDRENYISIGDLSSSTDWGHALVNVDVVVHLAARAHVLIDSCDDPVAEFRRVNVDATIALARQCMEYGVKRFVFVSSIGVNGSMTLETPFNEESVPQPHADYAESKLQAEVELWKVTQDSLMELVVIRPPLVYAVDSPGNFSRLLYLVNAGLPLPLGTVKNQRSMIALDNLIDFMRICIVSRAAANELFLVSDGKSFSTPEIIRLVAKGMGKRSFLVPVPEMLLRCVAAILRRGPMYIQLCKSLVIDSNKAQDVLRWSPPIDPVDALVRVGKDFKSLH